MSIVRRSETFLLMVTVSSSLQEMTFVGFYFEILRAKLALFAKSSPVKSRICCACALTSCMLVTSDLSTHEIFVQPLTFNANKRLHRISNHFFFHKLVATIYEKSARKILG